ncbi:adenylate/guanylate cyclase domain-containing protein [Isoptericola sp. b490]|uniref:adenylate/guanylate cyclase domain-containing protein n=1 Tax=Actinotalea lenta TaxID=3064654 RepID=UPI0027125B75|nr:adenylate/guanylate cyclase domain-containing protein [Isoptericola sp. b490]MDO8122571.1 adenylate/guanylate cyclase domain-containing protein [Isoptericola sp. b490]
MSDLRRHVPPIALGWDAEVPGASWRAVDGTLVFADVSGFTALTERLSQRGRIGAEEIVETLNRVFGPMLLIAAARGGEMLKFGGDALLFLFRGDGHAEQACDAAVEMRASLRESTAVPTSVGRLALSMSVGVHSGQVHLFLVGTPSRELVILGPAASRTALAEHTADAGQIVVTAQTRARLAPGSTRARGDGALLLTRRRTRTPHRPAPDAPHADGELLRSLFPRDLGDYLAPGPPDPEHRIATIAFIRFSGTDAVLAQDGPDRLATILDELLTTVEAALATEDVTLLATDLDTDGGKLFLGSGVPRSREDDEGRMLRALRHIADAGLALPLQLGVNRGHVFVAELGVQDRAAYSAMGDTTNTAARIAAKAPPDVVYAHPTVLDHSRTRFAVTPAGPFAMKGKALPLLVYEVGEETGTREPRSTGRAPFIGRENELAAVRAALAAALAGDGGVVTVDGATGMGKSRLVSEALRAFPGTDRFVVRAEPYGASSAYRVFRDPLRAHLGISRDTPTAMGQALLDSLGRRAPDLVPMAPLLADVVQVDVPATPEADRIDEQFRADRVADLLIDLLERTQTRPIVLVAEEAHWADEASARLLERLATATAGRPWAVVAVRRGATGGFAPDVGTTVVLEPLPPDAVERLVIAATEATPLRPHEVAAIVQRAEGNPLFVEEVTRIARGVGSLGALPESVQAAMSTQIDQLPTNVRRVLRHAAVLGRSFRRTVIAATLAQEGLDLDPATMDALGDFIEPDGAERLRFRNALLRDAAYEGLAYRVRARVHRTAGEVLERLSTDLDSDSPTLALHFERAGDAERTWRYAQRAGDLARRSYANADAADHFETALEVSRRVPSVGDADRARLWSLVGELRELAGMFDESVDAYRRAARLVRGDGVAGAEILVRQAAVYNRIGSFSTALRVVARARSLVEDATDTARRTLVKLDALTALARVEQERPVEARQWAERAAAAAREVGDDETLVRVLMLIDGIDLRMGAPGLGSRHLEALDICVANGWRPQESTVRGNLGALAYLAGRWTEAADWYATSRQVAQEIGKAFGAAETGVNLAELLVNQGRLDEAEAVLVDSVRVLRAAGAASFIAQGEIQLARINLSRGELADAEHRAFTVARRLLDLGQPATALEASLVGAEAVIRSGRPHEALGLIDAAEAAANTEAVSSLPQLCLQRGRALLALDEATRAAEVAEAGLTAAREQGLPYEEAQLLRVVSDARGRLGDEPGAALAWREAQDILTSVGAHLPAGAPTDAP